MFTTCIAQKITFTPHSRISFSRCNRAIAAALIALFALPSLAHAQRGRSFGGGGRLEGNGEKIEPEKLPFELGAATVPDRETFEKLSYQGPMRMDDYLSNIECVKFILENAMTDSSKTYWMNTQNIQAHPQFMGAVGIQGGLGSRGRGGEGGGAAGGGKTMRGAICYLPRVKCPDGTPGLYIFDFQPNDRFSFEEIKFARDAILKTMPFVNGKLAYHPLAGSITTYRAEKAKYDNSDVDVYLDEELYEKIAYLPLNIAESFGRLSVMENNFQPSPRDIVICRTLPNQMPRVAGVISEVRQTPLSHVNLRAIQDKVPNAYIAGASEAADIKARLGKWVKYQVTPQGYRIREATQEEVDKHFEAIRPTQPQSLNRDLSRTKILPLKEISFKDSASFGAKTTNVAAMLTFGFPDQTVPDGVAIPFYFYDEFMKYNGFYEDISKVLANKDFQTDRKLQEAELKRIRSLVKSGKMPDWMSSAINEAYETFPKGSSVRFRSSTNNEDLTGFSGAGLYDSCTHHPDEGHPSKSVKQIFASLWNFRAFEEREFYRVDHMQVAMGVLMHPNYSDELANGVAVTDDILYETNGNYYLNVQVGEDLVTNPDAQSAPEEVLLGWWKRDGHQVVRPAAGDKPLLNQEQLDELRSYLAKIHGKFRTLYEKSESDKFAMEIEFKVTSNGKIAIKQARPWVY